MVTEKASQHSPLLARAKKDRATVTAQGVALEAPIDGVIAHKPPLHADHRGALVEMFTTPEFWKADFAYAYQTSIRPGMLKGWYAHEKKLDRYHLVSGELLVLLYDDREGSPTRGCFQKLVLSEATFRQVLIPPLVWHLSLNVGQGDAILVNLPSTHYNHESPDRFHISIDSGDIPIDVRAFFPVTFSLPNRVADSLC
jgi:dTDP-4-dehydrorhamnose 3,5-epimerase